MVDSRVTVPDRPMEYLLSTTVSGNTPPAPLPLAVAVLVLSETFPNKYNKGCDLKAPGPICYSAGGRFAAVQRNSIFEQMCFRGGVAAGENVIFMRPTWKCRCRCRCSRG
ncbi:unnamed protein product, partial [Iphiclides podalirius]